MNKKTEGNVSNMTYEDIQNLMGLFQLMNYKALENTLLTLKGLPQGTEEIARTILQTPAHSATLEEIQALTSQNNVGILEQSKVESGSDILIFTKKEIDSMPKSFRKQFRCNGLTAHVHRRRSGKNNWNYEIRCQINHQKVNVSSNNLAEAREKFIKRLKEVESGVTEQKNNGIPTTFDGFANYFFENFYKRKVVASTLRIALNQYKNHIQPHFGDMPIKSVTPVKCQALIDRLDSEGKGKTADDVSSILNMIFKAAVKHCVLPNNPMDMVFHKQHEREHGTALTKEEEKLLLTSMTGTPQLTMFAIALYTGMRPNEYETAKLNGKFIVAVNSKRKDGKVEYKKIPITPMLKPYLDGVDRIKFCSLRVLREKFNKLFPNHRLYDLRTTFYTRCQECGISSVARDSFVGHSLGALGNTYTDLSDEFLLKEGEKFKY